MLIAVAPAFNVYTYLTRCLTFYFIFGFCARIVLHILSECEINVTMPLKWFVFWSLLVPLFLLFLCVPFREVFPTNQITKKKSHSCFVVVVIVVVSFSDISGLPFIVKWVIQWMNGWNRLKMCVLHIPMKSMVFTMFEWYRNNEAIQFEPNARENSLNSCVLFI